MDMFPDMYFPHLLTATWQHPRWTSECPGGKEVVVPGPQYKEVEPKQSMADLLSEGARAGVWGLLTLPEFVRQGTREYTGGFSASLRVTAGLHIYIYKAKLYKV